MSPKGKKQMAKVSQMTLYFSHLGNLWGLAFKTTPRIRFNGPLLVSERLVPVLNK